MPHILALATLVPSCASVPSPTRRGKRNSSYGREGLSHFERGTLMLTVYLPHISCQP